MDKEREIFTKYFERIKLTWSELGVSNKIIPFCTPLKKNPKFLIIGINHTDFSSNKNEAKTIAENFSQDLPDVNTFIEHDHRFAKGLRSVIKRVHSRCNGFDDFPNEDWVGTNRIAIQTSSSDIFNHYDQLESLDQYDKCKKEIDKLLRSLISFMQPKNIILAGQKSFEGLYFPKDSKLKDVKHKKILIDVKNRKTTNVIPIPHLSRGSFFKEAEERILNAIEDNCCYL